MTLADDIAMSARHVRLGERHLTRQHQLIAQLDHDGHSTVDAIEFLHLLEEVQMLHRVHLSRLQRKACGEKFQAPAPSRE
ncbi:MULTISPECIES: hypothetical protein [unclassified Mesorhizobium]|jgi:hypothetical protein|uniref:hypothetical protein n=1 Tax=unclassified Mesorhizobium TaxID=325217 RepID=UPI000FD9B630|nr:MULTISPECIES: hypothetical protein [unclassified Mesorhizobium]RWL42832.1 MAG: hypothetical protein EOR60_24170 [Mesorhizobium sp.]TGQ12384.1 hypothetical protein EN862_016000 [Mesorhizobium sp. M2E.F.Ca.ET.219.01.1.1]TGS15829.1 hypothetical protein EN852_009325 [Mesorhizobium sp. M2E.F.Ca.ET.209.01.1.1]TGT68205.1 hypothetical protein EN809_027270 [Mesorhizobium sp. M2E.F.Ca.ET.166.01.1.1]TGW01209.1 hypothetical protein EN797_012580 [Mesorhizobium sp. M2E.F.Ca.ET.154.01.1.1]